MICNSDMGQGWELRRVPCQMLDWGRERRCRVRTRISSGSVARPLVSIGVICDKGNTARKGAYVSERERPLLRQAPSSSRYGFYQAGCLSQPHGSTYADVFGMEPPLGTLQNGKVENEELEVDDNGTGIDGVPAGAEEGRHILDPQLSVAGTVAAHNIDHTRCRGWCGWRVEA